MKPTTDWLKEETALTESLVRRIQVDTLMHAAKMCRQRITSNRLHAADRLERLAQELSGMNSPTDKP